MHNKIVLEIKELLDKNIIKYNFIEHNETSTSEEAAHIRGTTAEQGAKALILLTYKSNKNFMVVLPGNLKIDNKKVKQFIKEDFTFEKADIIAERYDLQVGGIPPFWNIIINNMNVDSKIGTLELLIDNKLLENKEIAFNAGLKTCSIIMESKDYLKLASPAITGEWSK